MPRLLVTLVVGILVSALAGCALPPPERTYLDQQPKTAPVRNMTSFTPALQCMDQLLQATGKNNFMITSAGIPDATGQMQAGTKEMLISTIAKMSTKSNAFTFVDFDLDKRDVLAAQQLIGIQAGFEVPRYYIRGAITQVDKGVITDRIGGGIGFSLGSGGSSSNSTSSSTSSSTINSSDRKGTLGYSSDIGTSVITIDLNMGDLVTRRIIPGVSTSNSIVVTRKGTGFDADAQIEKFGVAFEFSMDRSEGSHQALRTLVELTLIEVLGKFAGVPYWSCLQVKQTDPGALVKAHSQYEELESDTEAGNEPLLKAIVTGLVAGGYLGNTGDIRDAGDPRLKQAVAKYQADNDLVATGRLSFELYYSMLNKGLIQPGGTVTGGVKPASKPATAGGSINVYMSTSHGTTPTYRVGERLDLNAQVSEDGYLYCYYGDETGKIARIYPNRYTPNPYLSAGQRVNIPSRDAQFSIEFTDPGSRQEVLCLASKQELGVKLPASFKVADLEPVGVSSFEEVVQAFQALDREGLSFQRIRLSVVQ